MSRRKLHSPCLADPNLAKAENLGCSAGGDVFVHGMPGDDRIAVSAGSLQVVVNGSLLTYDLATTTGLRVRGHAGDDQTSFNAGRFRRGPGPAAVRRRGRG